MTEQQPKTASKQEKRRAETRSATGTGRSVRGLYLKRRSYWFARQTEGKRVWVNLQTADLAEAITRKTQIEHSPLLAPDCGITGDAERFVAFKLATNRYSEESAKTKIIALKQFAEFLPIGATIRNVTAAQVHGFYRSLQRRVTEGTAQGYMVTLRSFFRWAMEERKARLDNPVASVKLDRHEGRAREAFVCKEIKLRLIDEAGDDDLRFILFCGFDAGLRRKEICEVRVDWFDGENLHVRTADGDRLREGERKFRSKVRTERAIPLTEQFKTFLPSYLAGKKPIDFALRPDVTHGKWRYRYDIRRPLEIYMARQGMTWVTAHVMRHSFASILASSGVSIYKIAKWLGDSVKTTEKHYAKLAPGDRDIQALG